MENVKLIDKVYSYLYDTKGIQLVKGITAEQKAIMETNANRLDDGYLTESDINFDMILDCFAGTDIEL